MALVFGADDHNFAVALDDFAFVAHGFDRRSDFHFDFLRIDDCPFGGAKRSALATPGDPALGEIVRAHFQLDGVAGDDADVIHAQLARNVRRDGMPVGKLHAERCIRQRFDDFAFRFDDVVFGH